MKPQLSRLVGQAFFGEYKVLRPIQKESCSPILDGQDVLIRSATASGKTEAAMAPLLDRHLPTIRDASGVVVIVVSPTRALVNDLFRRLEKPLGHLGIRLGIRHGERDQLSLVQKPQVLLTTPESLDGLVGRRDRALQSVEAVVLDEAHLLFNTQRGLQVGITLNRLEMWLGRNVQAVGLSATIGSPAEVWRFFRPGRTVVDVSVVGGRPLEYQIRFDVSIVELVEYVKLCFDRKVLVFVNSRKECESLVDKLRSSGVDPSQIFVHHSSLASDLRRHTEETFSSTSRGVCVATSTLELGIDIGAIDLVILYGVPGNWQSLAQRVGRGNRRSDFIEALFCVPTSPAKPSTLVDQLTFQALLVEMFDENPEDIPAHELVGAYAQQLCSEIDAQGRFIGINPLAAIGAPWSHLDQEATLKVLDSLVDRGVLQKHPVYNRYGPDTGLHELRERWQVWSNFVGSGSSIDVRTDQRHVGKIGTKSLASLDRGDVFLLDGRRWRVERITPQAINVISTTANPTREVEQGGSRIKPSETQAEWIRQVICRSVEGQSVFPKSEAARLTELVETLRPALRQGLTPMYEDAGRFLYFTFAGPLVNDALAGKYGIPNLTNAVVLTTEQEWDPQWIPRTLDELIPRTQSSPRERSLFQNLLPEEMIDEEYRSILMNDPILQGVLERVRSGGILKVEDTRLPTLFRL